MSHPKRILISGAGIAGPAVALLLTRAGHKCTVVERASEVRTAGQQIDISGNGIKVIKAMGIEEAVRAFKVQDDGLNFVDANDTVMASFPVSKTGGGTSSPVREIEIMRSDLAKVLYEKTRDDVKYVFGDYITTVSQRGSGVTISFANSKQDQEFDMIIAADGLRSKTREIVFGSSNTKLIGLNQIAGFFSVPWQKSDSTFSRWFNAPGGRCVCLRPNIKQATTSAYLCITRDDEDFGRVANLPLEQQRELITNRFAGVKWETQRILKELQTDRGESFYLQEVAQAKALKWVKGRVALLGDAGYCPSPVSGQGTTLAFVGAYILAGCIATYSDAEKALSEYEKTMRPFAEGGQKLLPGAPWIVNPQTAWGIWVLNRVLFVVSLIVNSGLGNLLGTLIGPLMALGGNGLQLPEYPALDKTEV